LTQNFTKTLDKKGDLHFHRVSIRYPCILESCTCLQISKIIVKFRSKFLVYSSMPTSWPNMQLLLQFLLHIELVLPFSYLDAPNKKLN
jgi:hypothetical protein